MVFGSVKTGPTDPNAIQGWKHCRDCLCYLWDCQSNSSITFLWKVPECNSALFRLNISPGCQAQTFLRTSKNTERSSVLCFCQRLPLALWKKCLWLIFIHPLPYHTCAIGWLALFHTAMLFFICDVDLFSNCNALPFCLITYCNQ